MYQAEALVLSVAGGGFVQSMEHLVPLLSLSMAAVGSHASAVIVSGCVMQSVEKLLGAVAVRTNGCRRHLSIGRRHRVCVCVSGGTDAVCRRRQLRAFGGALGAVAVVAVGHHQRPSSSLRRVWVCQRRHWCCPSQAVASCIRWSSCLVLSLSSATAAVDSRASAAIVSVCASGGIGATIVSQNVTLHWDALVRHRSCYAVVRSLTWCCRCPHRRPPSAAERWPSLCVCLCVCQWRH